MGTARSARIADQIQRSLADLIRTEVRDPRVGMVTLTGVELSRDQSHAKVFFTVLGPPAAGGEALEGLQRAAGFLRSQLAHELTTRKVPELHFAYDEPAERGGGLPRLPGEAGKPPPAPSPPPRARRGRHRRAPRPRPPPRAPPPS